VPVTLVVDNRKLLSSKLGVSNSNNVVLFYVVLKSICTEVFEIECIILIFFY